MPYVGEIRMFAGNFGPNGWMLCQGQTLPISENEVLFQLIGTTYGGDGQETFNLPNLQGRLPVHMGQGPGLSHNYQIGEMAGVESVTLTAQQIPVHTHSVLAHNALGTSANPQGNIISQGTETRIFLRDSPVSAMPAQTVSPVGGSQPHDNMAPTLVINYIISLFGVFPSPS